MKTILYLLSLLVALPTIFSQTEKTEFRSEFFYILVIDGPRYSETFGDSTCTHIPNLCKQLKPQGTFFSNFSNNGKTLTVPGHTAIMTGVYQKISNIGTGLPKNPSFFQYYLRDKNKPSHDAQIIASKGKLNVLSDTKSKEWQKEKKPIYFCGPKGDILHYGPDAETFKMVKDTISTQDPPHLLLVNLLGVDVWGHGNNYKKYLENIRLTDRYALDFWNTIQSNPILKDKTTLFITNDHGRHLDGIKEGFKEHGDGCEGCRHISLLVLGPDIPKNRTIQNAAEMIDIPTTIAAMLHLNFPTGKGRFLSELFTNTEDKN